MNTKEYKYWLIRAWDSNDLLFEEKIKINCIGDKKLMELIKVLTAKVSLCEDEIIDSYVNKNTKRYTDYLEVIRSNGKKLMYTCGTNPHITVKRI